MTSDNKKNRQTNQSFTRRQFIKSTAVGATGICLAPSFAFSADTDLSRVINVTHANLINSDDQVNAKNARQCVDEALLLLTQKEDIKDAWMEIFPNLQTKDTISLKVNTINRKCPTHPQTAYSIAQSMIDSLDIDPNSLIIWDRSSSELKKAGYTINESDKGIRCFGTIQHFSGPRWILNKKQDETNGVGYDKALPINVGNGTISHLSKIITQMSTYMINVPVLKDHSIAGVTLSLKNHYGSIDNPRDCHKNFCEPFIGKINAAPQIKDKTKLFICDAAFGIYEGGPRGAPQWKNNSILASEDPVALDYTGLQIINAKRKKQGKNLISKKAVHVKSAKKIGLGNAEHDKISFKEVDLF